MILRSNVLIEVPASDLQGVAAEYAVRRFQPPRYACRDLDAAFDDLCGYMQSSRNATEKLAFERALTERHEGSVGSYLAEKTGYPIEWVVVWHENVFGPGPI